MSRAGLYVSVVLFVAGVESIGILVRVIDALIRLIASVTYWRKEFIVYSFSRAVRSGPYWCEEWEVCALGDVEDARSARIDENDDRALAEDA